MVRHVNGGETCGTVLQYLQAESVKYDTCFQKSSYLPWRLKFGHLGASGYQIYFSVYRVVNERVTFWLQPPSHCLMRVRLLHCMHVRLRNGYTWAYVQIMQHTLTHKAVTRRVEAKKLLSRRRQSKYRGFMIDQWQFSKQNVIILSDHIWIRSHIYFFT